MSRRAARLLHPAPDGAQYSDLIRTTQAIQVIYLYFGNLRTAFVANSAIRNAYYSNFQSIDFSIGNHFETVLRPVQQNITHFIGHFDRRPHHQSRYLLYAACDPVQTSTFSHAWIGHSRACFINIIEVAAAVAKLAQSRSTFGVLDMNGPEGNAGGRRTGNIDRPPCKLRLFKSNSALTGYQYIFGNGQPALATYSATKFALRGLLRRSTLNGVNYGIAVLNIWPSFVNTSMARRIGSLACKPGCSH